MSSLSEKGPEYKRNRNIKQLPRNGAGDRYGRYTAGVGQLCASYFCGDKEEQPETGALADRCFL